MIASNLSNIGSQSTFYYWWLTQTNDRVRLHQSPYLKLFPQLEIGLMFGSDFLPFIDTDKHISDSSIVVCTVIVLLPKFWFKFTACHHYLLK